MSHQESNFDTPEEELGESTTPFDVPPVFQWGVAIVCFALIAFSAYYFYCYLASPTKFASPKDLGLMPLVLFSVTAIFLVFAPWRKLGVRITKIGGIEFEQIVATQASEHAEELAYLQDRIEILETKIRKLDELTEFTESFEEPKLREELEQFLTKYQKWAFSPSRIRAWGSKQQGFSVLANYEYPFIRSTLQKMVSDGTLETRISRKGNTLYRIAKP